MYASILDDTSGVHTISIARLAPTVEIRFYEKVYTLVITLFENACKALVEEGALAEQLRRSGNRPLRGAPFILGSVGLSRVDAWLQERGDAARILETMRMSVPDASLPSLSIMAYFTQTPPFAVGGRHYTDMHHYILCQLGFRFTAGYTCTTPADVDDGMDEWLQRRVTHALTTILPIKMESTVHRQVLDQVPSETQFPQDGFLGEYATYATVQVLGSIVRTPPSAPTVEMALFEDASSFFRQWTDTFQVPSLLDILRVTKEILRGKSLTPARVQWVLTRLMPDCGWEAAIDVPPSFVVPYDENIAGILWGVTASNLRRLQQQEIRTLPGWAEAVHRHVTGVVFTFEELVETVDMLATVCREVSGGDSGVEGVHVALGLRWCGLRLGDVVSCPQEVAMTTGVSMTTEYGRVMLDTAYTMSLLQNQEAYTDLTRSRLVLFARRSR
jgi:hypothetical protein